MARKLWLALPGGLLAALLLAPAATARPDAIAAAKVKYPRFSYAYKVVEFSGLGRNEVSGVPGFNGKWEVPFNHQGGTLSLRNPIRSKSAPNGAVAATELADLKLEARRLESTETSHIEQQCKAERAASQKPEARIYYGPKTILSKPRRVATSRVEIHWVLPTFPDVSCEQSTFAQGALPAGREAFTLKYTLSRFKRRAQFELPFEFRFPYQSGAVTWTGRLKLERIR